MKAILQLTVGDDVLAVEHEIGNIKDLFKFHSMFADIPKTGPHGESDLKLCFRKTQEGFEYYSVVSPKAGMEFMFGQTKVGQELFPKGWVKIQRDIHQPVIEEHNAPAATGPAPLAMAASASLTTGTASVAVSEADQLRADLTSLVWKTLVAESSKEGGGDFLSALLGAPKATATVEELKRGIAAAHKAIRVPALLEWAAAKWRYESDSKSSLVTKMRVLGLMVRYLDEAGDFQDLMLKIKGDPTQKDSRGIKVVLDNLESWFRPEEGALTDKDVGF